MDYKQLVADALAPALPDLTADDILSKIEQPKTSKQGDLAFPTFTLAKIMHKAPQMIAGDVVEKIDQSNFEKVVAMGPYVNFFFKKDAFSADILNQVLTNEGHFGDGTLGAKGQVPIDMSSPNIAKPISMGHLRSTVIGNSLANILSKLDYQPVKINHLGDWGTQFGKLITAYKMWGREAEVNDDPINNLLKYYVRLHKEDVHHP